MIKQVSLVLLALLSCIVMPAFSRSRIGLYQGYYMTPNGQSSHSELPYYAGISRVHMDSFSPHHSYLPGMSFGSFNHPHLPTSKYLNIPSQDYHTSPLFANVNGCSGGNCGYWGGCRRGHCGPFYDFRPCHSVECFDGSIHGFDCFDGYCQRVCNEGICRDFDRRGCHGRNCRDEKVESDSSEKRQNVKKM